MGLNIEEQQVKGQIFDANIQIIKLCGDLSGLNTSINAFASDTSLRGNAYSKAKAYMNKGYMTISQSVILLGSRLISANQTVNSKYDECLPDDYGYKTDTDVIDLMITELKNQNASYEEEKNNYNFFQDVGDFFAEGIWFVDSINEKISANNRIIKKLEAVRLGLYNFNTLAASMYDSCDYLITKIKNALCDLGKCTDYTTIPDLSTKSWFTTLDFINKFCIDGDQKKEYIDASLEAIALKQAGVTVDESGCPCFKSDKEINDFKTELNKLTTDYQNFLSQFDAVSLAAKLSGIPVNSSGAPLINSHSDAIKYQENLKVVNDKINELKAKNISDIIYDKSFAEQYNTLYVYLLGFLNSKSVNIDDTMIDIGYNNNSDSYIDLLTKDPSKYTDYEKLALKKFYDNTLEWRGNHAYDPDVQKLYHKYLDELDINTWHETDGAYYNDFWNEIHIDRDDDCVNVKQPGCTYFHEYGHMVDDFSKTFGDISSTKDFSDTLESDFNNYVQKVKKEQGFTTDTEAYVFIEDWLRNDNPDLKNGVSDMVNGLSGGKCSGNWSHSADYYNDSSIACESYAHFFEASMYYDSTKIDYMKEVFPESYKKFKEMVDEELN